MGEESIRPSTAEVEKENTRKASVRQNPNADGRKEVQGLVHEGRETDGIWLTCVNDVIMIHAGEKAS